MTNKAFLILCSRATEEGKKDGEKNKALSEIDISTEYGLPHKFCYNGSGKFYWEAYMKARFGSK